MRVEASRRVDHSRCGLTLFEVMLALAILAGAIAVLGELSRNAGRNAVRTSELTQAQLICESLVAKLVAGVIEPAPVSQVPYQADADWLYSVALDRGELIQLVSMTVTVERRADPGGRPVSFSLVRWIPDPGIEIPNEPEEPERPETGGDATAEDSGPQPNSGDSNVAPPRPNSGASNVALPQ